MELLFNSLILGQVSNKELTSGRTLGFFIIRHLEVVIVLVDRLHLALQDKKFGYDVIKFSPGLSDFPSSRFFKYTCWTFPKKRIFNLPSMQPTPIQQKPIQGQTKMRTSNYNTKRNKNNHHHLFAIIKKRNIYKYNDLDRGDLQNTTTRLKAEATSMLIWF